MVKPPPLSEHNQQPVNATDNNATAGNHRNSPAAVLERRRRRRHRPCKIILVPDDSYTHLGLRAAAYRHVPASHNRRYFDEVAMYVHWNCDIPKQPSRIGIACTKASEWIVSEPRQTAGDMLTACINDEAWTKARMTGNNTERLARSMKFLQRRHKVVLGQRRS